THEQPIPRERHQATESTTGTRTLTSPTTPQASDRQPLTCTDTTTPERSSSVVLEQWLRMADAVGLRRDEVDSGARLAPGVRFAVDAYVRFCSVRPWQEAVAASLTQLFVPELMRVRSDALARHYGLTADDLAYFSRHSDVAARESEQALTLLLAELRTHEAQHRALDAVSFKCDVLNALLDAVEAIR
ncbi:MAG: hypothetical protein WBF75_13170, partial [Pseudonocardiaceae bacterium]